jgi:hypothetical protein
MSLRAPKPRLAAHPRRAAALALAALAFVLSFLGATSERQASASVAQKVHALTLTRSAATTPDPERRAPAVRLSTEGPDETADLGSRAPTPTSAVRSRGDRGGNGDLPEFSCFVPAARGFASAATGTLLDGASGARIAALHARAVQIGPDFEPNPARGPPLK